MTDDLCSPCRHVRLLSRSQSSAFQVSLARVFPRFCPISHRWHDLWFVKLPLQFCWHPSIALYSAAFLPISPACSSSSSHSNLIVGSLRQIQFSSSQLCHGLHLLFLPGGTISSVCFPAYSVSSLHVSV